MRKFFIICGILLDVLCVHAQDPSYYKDIAPIIQSKCAPCHRPGEAGPFSLLTWEDVAKRASFIKKVIQGRYMPPWRADRQYVHFANERGLSDNEIALITRWIDIKTPQGKPSDYHPPANKPVQGTLYNRAPDLVLSTSDSFHLIGDNGERFVIFKIPFELKDSANVEAIEFFCNNKKLIHHANYAVQAVPDENIAIKGGYSYVNLTDDDRTKVDQYMPYRKIMSYYGGYIPGTSFEYFPKEFGWVMPRRGVILLTVHYAPSATDEASICGVNLFFKKTPITRVMKVVSFGSGGIGEGQIEPIFYIKPNAVQTFRLEVTNPSQDQSLLYVWPHMHLLGKEYKAFITTPAGDTIRLVHIPEWDFRWQEIYRFPHPVKVPKGSVIHLECTYDNTANNPFNPNSPPKAVFSMGDMKTKDEMMTMMMGFLPYKEGDEKISLE
ncbi:cytochrome c [Flavitalea sp. BT771]|uniref:cytochrome c n=1 Tax=Flavitalea sp. BT771 TaxID=3063329 RepID=UPI0026E32D6E|nr:cytochrome c [Flavitalea sp. BT771]MDO6430199.1 cytochrome c [Flavitalea sp. BT771]MDV6219662.1 cytochrome c [Flavitalea sp. BT771]